MTKPKKPRISCFQLTSFGLSLALVFQGLMPYGALASDSSYARKTSKAILDDVSEPQAKLISMIQAASPVKMDEDRNLSQEEAENLLISQRAQYKTEIDKKAVDHHFAKYISKLPVLTAATMGAALGADAELDTALSRVQSQRLIEDSKKTVLATLTDGAESEPSLIHAGPDQHERIDIAQADGGSQYEQLTRKSIQKLIEFERLNTYFRVETTRQSKWRRLRTFLCNEQLSAGVAAFTLIYMYETGRALSRGVLFNTVITVNSVKEPIVGRLHHVTTRGNFFSIPPNNALEAAWFGTFPFFSIAIAMESFELMQNIYNDIKVHKRGLDPAASKAKAIALRDEIDKLLLERDAAAKGTATSAQEQEVMNAEGKLLHDMRDMELDEFGRYYSAAKRARPAQNAYYATEITQRSVSLSAAIVGLVAQQRLELTTFGCFGILLTISAILQPCTPLAAIITNKIQKARAEKQLQGVLVGQQIHSVDEMNADRKKFEDLALANTQLPVYGSRIPIYKMSNDNATESVALSKREEDAARKLFKTALLLKSFSGGMLGAAGIVAMMTFAPITNLRHVYDIGFTFSLLEEIVEWYGAVDGPLRYLYRENQDSKSRRAGLMPGQVLERRINNLDRMEASVSGKVVPSTQ